LEAEQEVWLSFAEEAVHLFDSESERALRATNGSAAA
jgi:hypothetical protein